MMHNISESGPNPPDGAHDHISLYPTFSNGCRKCLKFLVGFRV
jgi:hypothetical protein